MKETAYNVFLKPEHVGCIAPIKGPDGRTYWTLTDRNGRLIDSEMYSSALIAKDLVAERLGVPVRYLLVEDSQGNEMISTRNKNYFD